ncbi:hypothetical protein [Sphingobium nicotianae]|uniref:Uncharacterized protein n=1 Tax=Sphingobium nicotianae TaxID=2782607 RepID=A0A9X1IS40_9SPHN|nr:hypothetical protein [Sphingobium nicotianae]MBT2188068.1 hypothetical protein [Sphingobium nicotianae]
MKRALVLTNDGARHPFRARLPRHVFAMMPQDARPARQPRSDDQDWKLFLLSFAAFFTVAYTFIA